MSKNTISAIEAIELERFRVRRGSSAMPLTMVGNNPQIYPNLYARMFDTSKWLVKKDILDLYESCLTNGYEIEK